MFSKKKLIAFLKAFYHSHKRVPTQKDLNTHPDMPSYSTYRKFFGNYSNAIKEAELKKGENMKKIISLLATIVLSGSIVYAGVGVDCFYKSRMNEESSFLGFTQSTKGLRLYIKPEKVFSIYVEYEADRGYLVYRPDIAKNILNVGFSLNIERFNVKFYVKSMNFKHAYKKTKTFNHLEVNIPIFYYGLKK